MGCRSFPALSPPATLLQDSDVWYPAISSYPIRVISPAVLRPHFQRFASFSAQNYRACVPSRPWGPVPSRGHPSCSPKLHHRGTLGSLTPEL